MSDKPSNPPLFTFDHSRERFVQDGPLEQVGLSTEITLRDLFAAFSLAGMTSKEERLSESERLAVAAYADADAMLKIREYKS